MTWRELMTDPWQTMGAVGAALAAVLLVAGATWKTARFLRRVVHFLDDWTGEAERPGIPGRPGVMVRLESVEERTRQLQPNGGSHLADKIAAINTELQNHAGTPQQLDAIREHLDSHIADCLSGAAYPQPTVGHECGCGAHVHDSGDSAASAG